MAGWWRAESQVGPAYDDRGGERDLPAGRIAVLAAGIVALLGFAVVRSGCRAQATTAAPPGPSAPDPIAQVESSLLPAVLIAGEREEMGLADRMRHHKVPGVSVAVIDGGRIEWAKGYGTTTAGGAQPVTPDTLFQAASASKPVSAMAALALVARGALALDEDVNRRLRSWKIPASRYTRREKVTLRRLASHSAGLSHQSGWHYAPGEPVPTLFQVLDGKPPARFGPTRVERVPGTGVAYSNGGYSVLQVLLTDVSGLPFPRLMREVVLDPLGMSGSTFEQPLPEAFRLRAAAGHDDQRARIGTELHTRVELASGGLWTTPSDLARFVIEVLEASAGRSQKVLPPELARLMTTRALEDRSFGMEVSGEGASLRVYHGGWNDGYKAELVGYPARRQGAVVMSNGEHGGRRLNEEILRSIARVYGWPDYQPQQRTAVQPDPALLADLAGGYGGKDGSPGDVAITLSQGDLFAQAPGTPKDRLRAASATEFFLSDALATFTFQRDRGGAVTALTLGFGDGSVARLPKVR